MQKITAKLLKNCVEKFGAVPWTLKSIKLKLKVISKAIELFMKKVWLKQLRLQES